MKRLITICAIVSMILAVSGIVQASTVNISIGPSQVPDEQQPRVNIGDAPTGFTPDSWENSATGKVNWHARYLLDGDSLSTLFPGEAATMKISDLGSISYFTKRPTGTVAGQDWVVKIYTRTDGTDDQSSWYGYQFTNNWFDHTSLDVWTQYSTGSGMTFSLGTGGGTQLTLAELSAGYGTELIEMISVQTFKPWSGIFDGYMDGLKITLASTSIGQVNFVPEPATMALLAAGGIATLLRRRRSSK